MAIKLMDRKVCPVTNTEQREFLCDTENDVESLPECNTGSTAVVIASGNVYMVNASGEWALFGGEA